MKEAHALVRATADLRASRTPFIVATVVRVIGSSYRRPGARLVATAEKRLAGSVSGGCLERDLVRTAFFRTRNGPAVVRYDSSDPDDPEARLGCGGIVDVLLERVEPGETDPIARAERVVAEQRPTAIATVFESTIAGLAVGTRWELDAVASDDPLLQQVLAACRRKLARHEAPAAERFEDARGAIDVLVEAIEPPPSLFVFGAGFDAGPLADAAHRLGWSVTVWDPLARPESWARFANADVVLGGSPAVLAPRIDRASSALAVVMSHDLRHDEAALGAVLPTRVQYIGVLGPRHRSERLERALAVPLFADPRVRAPIGLDLGAETPEELSLAMTAEMLAVLRRPSRRLGPSSSAAVRHDEAAE